jgi:uncharacterized membrane protein YdjX (TVP38/TMEM64 family)
MRGESDSSDQPSVADAPADAIAQSTGGASSQPGHAIRWLLGGCVALVVIALIWFGPQLWQLVRDEKSLAVWVASLGWWGPLALVALNAIQIVVAPIPGYVVQVAAGFLFGPFWGGLWASLGLMIGSSSAFWLARLYGRPVVGRLVGADRLAKWEHLSHSSSTLLWLILLLSPIGDLPYFLAGLARVSFIKIFVVTLAVRVPSTFVVAAAGAGVMLLNWWQIVLLFAALIGLLFLFLRYQEQIVRWSDQRVHQQVQRRLEPSLHEDQ